MKILYFTIASLTVVILLLNLDFKSESHKTYSNQDDLKASVARGKIVYNDFCIQCHLSKGEGVPGIFPPLANSNWLSKNRYKEAIQVVKYGQQGEITVNGKSYDGVMADLELYDEEVADVMNYIMNNWGNSQESMITEAMVKAISK